MLGAEHGNYLFFGENRINLKLIIEILEIYIFRTDLQTDNKASYRSFLPDLKNEYVPKCFQKPIQCCVMRVVQTLEIGVVIVYLKFYTTLFQTVRSVNGA